MTPAFISLVTALLGLTSIANGHGYHPPATQQGNLDWATMHMQEEHHIDNFDAASFFTLHDYDGSGAWTPDEVRKTYGLDDASTASVPEDKKQEVIREVFTLFDPLNSGVISFSDWMRLNQAGRKLPDFGLGPGHHGDMEYEYEIHHFEKYHGDDATEEELTHPEDIEHFRKHDEEELAQERLDQLEKMQIVEANIPQKFLRQT
ncbi:hypothetical protein DTO271G3_1830 [Paecilomyces variotii]|nr:hypothetical protein DTO271G3_1830 [Paecilomyces variotii]